MITDIPRPIDFHLAGLSYLNIAWENINDLCDNIDNFGKKLLNWDKFKLDEYVDKSAVGEIKKLHWEDLQRSLSLALSLIENGVELILKGRISEKSPYLLIIDLPRRWPAKCDVSDIPFSEFKTIDASELFKMHNTVCGEKLPQSSCTHFERLRARRNKSIHTVDKALKLSIREVYLDLLESYYYLIKDVPWLQCRFTYLEGKPESRLLTGDDYYSINFEVYQEMLSAMNFLKSGEIEKYFGLSKARRHICPICDNKGFRECEILPKCAQLDPNLPKSNILKCVICGEKSKIMRIKCQSADCPSNVIYLDKYKNEHSCLVCGESW